MYNMESDRQAASYVGIVPASHKDRGLYPNGPRHFSYYGGYVFCYDSLQTGTVVRKPEAIRRRAHLWCSGVKGSSIEEWVKGYEDCIRNDERDELR